MFDYIFAVRPSTVCNMHCAYCYRHDAIEANYKSNKFDIDAMLWHSEHFPNNVFNFCGYGETMMHPQFGDIIVSLSQLTHVDWVTNGTCFDTKQFNHILSDANHSNINAIVISVHFGQISDEDIYFSNLERHISCIRQLGIPVHITAIATDDNINHIIRNKSIIEKFRIILKSTFDRYTLNKDIVTGGLSTRSINLLRLNRMRIIPDAHPVVKFPYIGKRCPNGYRIFEVMHDGNIYDCSFDENRVEIGNINIKHPITRLTTERTCKSNCTTCIPMLRGGYLFNIQAPKEST